MITSRLGVISVSDGGHTTADDDRGRAREDAKVDEYAPLPEFRLLTGTPPEESDACDS